VLAAPTEVTVHAKKTSAPLIVRQRLPEPRKVTEWEVDLDKKKFGPHFKKDGKAVEAAVLATSQCDREELAKALETSNSVTVDVPDVGSGKVEIPKELIKIEQRTRTENIREYVPNVIEPSFGIGRILYSLLEHNYWTRGSDGGDEARGVSYRPMQTPSSQAKKLMLL
jgi:glycyl-tRNA synthetase